MGANVSSSFEDNSKAYVASPPKPISHALPSPTYHHPQQQQQQQRRNNINNNPKYSDNDSVKSRLIEIKGPERKCTAAAALVPSSNAAKVHHVIYFRSSPSCRGYLEASKASNTLIVMSFTNGWSEPCRYMEPIFHRFAAKYANVDFLKINVDELYDIACEFGVQTTPIFLLIKRGRLIDKVREANKEELQNKIEKHRYLAYN